MLNVLPIPKTIRLRHPNGSVARGEIKSTLTEKQAKEIYLATDKLKNLVQRYSVGITAIESIKRVFYTTESEKEAFFLIRNENAYGRAPRRPRDGFQSSLKTFSGDPEPLKACRIVDSWENLCKLLKRNGPIWHQLGK